MALRFRGLDQPIEVVYRKDSGSAPAPVDPYTQAAAQYGLSTGTAAYNAGLNRTNQTNPLGSSYWTASNPTTPTSTTQASSPGAPASASPSYSYNGNPLSFTGLTQGSAIPSIGSLGGSAPGMATDSMGLPPTYTQTTQLQPWAESQLQQPIDTSGLPGMPGGPDISQNLQNTQQAIYNQNMGYAAPEEALASEQLDSQLANEGATPGSAAYNNEQARLARQQTFTNQQAANAAITGGNQEQATLFGLGTQGLQNQIAVRNAPISEYNALTGAPGASATALTPDISGAFGQQYQGQLAGYNADTASNNSTTSAVGSLALAAAMYF